MSWWILYFPIGTTIAAGCAFYLYRSNRRLIALVASMRAAMDYATGVIDALASRGVLVCDECGKPIAPKTPTAMEQNEDGSWSMAHAGCVPDAPAESPARGP